MLAVTTCTPRDFYLGFVIGMAPGTLTMLYIGVNLKSIQDIATGERQASTVEILFMIISMSACVVLFRIVSKKSHKELMVILNQDSI